MAFIDDRHDLIGREVLATGKEGVRNFNALMGWIDPMRAKLVRQIVPVVLHCNHGEDYKIRIGLCLTSVKSQQNNNSGRAVVQTIEPFVATIGPRTDCVNAVGQKVPAAPDKTALVAGAFC
jgi:hypothetical protein